MDTSTWLEQVIDYIRLMPSLAKTAMLALAVTIEYVFPPFPGDTIVLAAGFLKAHGAFDIIEICIAVVAGSFIGAIFGYLIGLYIANNPSKYSWIRKITSSRAYYKFTHWYERWGQIFLLLNRFIPGIRALFFIAAGSSRLSFSKVLLLGVSSALLYNAALIGVGHWLGNNSDLILDFFYRYNLVAYVIIAVAALGFLIWWLLKKRA